MASDLGGPLSIGLGPKSQAAEWTRTSAGEQPLTHQELIEE